MRACPPPLFAILVLAGCSDVSAAGCPNGDCADGGEPLDAGDAQAALDGGAASVEPRWRFEGMHAGETARDVALDEGGAIEGSARWIAGQARGSIAIEGGDGVVAVHDPFAFAFVASESFRIELVFRTAHHGRDGTEGEGAIFAREASVSLRLIDGHLAFSIEDITGTRSEVRSARLVSDDRWHRVIAVRDRSRGELALSIDGFDVARAPDGAGDLATAATATLLGNAGGARFFGALDELAVAEGAVDLPSSTPELDDRRVFEAGVDRAGATSYTAFRIPAIVRTESGALVAFAEGRVSEFCDFGRIHTVMKRSLDDGQTWSPLRIVATNGAGKAGNPIPVADGERIALMVLETPCETGSGCSCRGDQRFAIYLSDDLGETWTERREITSDVTRPGWGGVLLGPGAGFRIDRGPHEGTLIVTAKHGTDPHLLASDDHGETWRIAAETTSAIPVNETTAAMVSDGSILVNARYQRSLEQSLGEIEQGFRLVGRVGTDWSYAGDPPFVHESLFRGSVVHGALLYREGSTRYGDEPRVLFSFPSGEHGSAAGRRRDMMVWVSRDDGETWARPRRVMGGFTAYSSLVGIADGRFGLLYEGGHRLGEPFVAYERLHFLRARPEWLDHASIATYSFEELADADRVTTIASAGGLPVPLRTTGTVRAIDGAHHSTALRFDGRSYACSGGTGGAFDFGPRDSFAIEATFRTTSHGDGGPTGSGSLVTKTDVGTTPSWWLRIEDGRARFLMSACRDQQINCGITAGHCAMLAECENYGVAGGSDLHDGGWHRVRIERDAAAGLLRLFIDGQAAGESRAPPTGLVANEEPLCLGAFADGGPERNFEGDLEGVRIELW
jgi:sialidase-1